MTDAAPSHQQPWGAAAPDRPWSPPPEPASQVPVTVPVAWLGRTSTEDSQDPTLSLPRQLRNARAALPPGWVIVAHFYDVESGRKDLADRGHSLAHTRFDIPIPRDGSISDLLEEAPRPDRRFAAVMCESIERVARRTYFGTKIEYELEQAGVALCAADEPIVIGNRAKRATPTLTRRVKQAVAEWYVLQMLELSWDGYIEHTHQAWNTGKPPYGYLPERFPHPVPARQAEGRTKHRLVPDPLRAPVVTRIFQLRALDRLGYDTIAERLNQDLDANPAPTSTRPGATLGRWCGSSVREVLINPKYTGYQVWNRRATKKGGRCNPPAEWVWSPRATHEPLVTRELFDEAATTAKRRQGSRTTPGISRDPRARRSYLLRSYVYCDQCGRRMFGKTRKAHAYYSCEKDPLQHSSAPWYETHPRVIRVREDLVVQRLSRFLSDRVFGPDRRFHLAATMAAKPDPALEQARAAEREALTRAVAALELRQERLIQSLAGGFGASDSEEPDDPAVERAFRDGIRKEHANLTKHGQAHRGRLAQLAQSAVPAGGTDRELIEALPRLNLALDLLPEEQQRRIYEAFDLEVRFHRQNQELQIQVTIDGDTLEGLTRTVLGAVAGETAPQPAGEPSRPEAVTKETPPTITGQIGAPVRCALGRIRTCDTGFRRAVISHAGHPFWPAS